MKPHQAISVGLALVLAGCAGADEKSGPQENQPGETGLAISTAANAGAETDVALMRYSIDRVACMDGEKIDPLSRTITVQLEKIMLPGGIPAFENSPLDKTSAHPFADHFEVVPAGCYDINATPLTKDGDLSTDCATAWAKGTKVEDGETTEVFLISQCKGTAVGAVDTTVAFNKPPTILNLTYQPSKFISAGDKDVICATAGDPNGDPISFTWDHADGPICDTPSVVSSVKSGKNTTECIAVTPRDAGSYTFEVKVYDLLHDEGGKLISFEQWLRAHGYPNDSHDSLRFPLYVAAQDGLVTPADRMGSPVQP
jgi:archaellum component FlaF (FlaF/FlaG flagellin family)